MSQGEKMTITVYWSMLESEWMRAKEPVPIEKKFYEKYNFLTNKDNPNAFVAGCPATKNYMKNLYGLSSIYDYSFEILEDEEVVSKTLNQNFFNNHVILRDCQNNFYSFAQKYIFFTKEDSLKVEAYLPPFLENNFISNNCHSIPATFDIGKWFRNLEFPFILNKNINRFNIDAEDIYAYIRFNTDEKIIFKKFIPTDQIIFYSNSFNNTVYGKKHTSPLSYFYSLSTFKKKIIKEIEKNLV
jgi:hypothetical protein